MAKRVLLHAIFTMGNDQGKGIKFGFVFLSFNVSNEIFAKDGEFFFWWGGGGPGKGCIVTSCLVGLLNQATNPKPAH
jgi:hypothetical protein